MQQRYGASDVVSETKIKTSVTIYRDPSLSMNRTKATHQLLPGQDGLGLRNGVVVGKTVEPPVGGLTPEFTVLNRASFPERLILGAIHVIQRFSECRVIRPKRTHR